MSTARAGNYLPKPIHVSSNAATETLLNLERQRDNIMFRIFVERTKLLRVQLAKPDDPSHWENGEYWHVALPQALFDVLGRYSPADVRRVCLAWLMFHAGNQDLSPSAATELRDLLAQQEQLQFVDGTYCFTSPTPQEPSA